MKKKTIIFSIICIFILTAFSGCTKQNAITNSKFEEKAKEKENSETDRKENCDRGSDHHTTSNSGYFRNVGNWEKFSFWR